MLSPAGSVRTQLHPSLGPDSRRAVSSASLLVRSGNLISAMHIRVTFPGGEGKEHPEPTVESSTWVHGMRMQAKTFSRTI